MARCLSFLGSDSVRGTRSKQQGSNICVGGVGCCVILQELPNLKNRLTFDMATTHNFVCKLDPARTRTGACHDF